MSFSFSSNITKEPNSCVQDTKTVLQGYDKLYPPYFRSWARLAQVLGPLGMLILLTQPLQFQGLGRTYQKQFICPMVRRDMLNVQRQGYSQDMGGVNVTVHVNPNII